MKNNVIMLRYGEIHLKGNNRNFFEKLLIRNINHALYGISHVLKKISGRYVITEYDEMDYDLIVDKLTKVFGLVSLSPALEMDTDQEAIENECKALAQTLSGTFRVNTKRADKKFPIKSDDFSAHIGELMLNANEKLSVDLHNPQNVITVEIRENNKTYILHEVIKCHGGMPVGSAGRGLLMLSGGIDSPVAGYMMAKRGIRLTAIHFASPPYTSPRAEDKVVRLLRRVSRYAGDMVMYTVPFTKLQEKIKDECPEELFTIIMRRLMMQISEKIAEKYECQALITGESLGQVASQTIGALSCTDEATDMLVFRPLIGMDKQEIIDIAYKIDTYDISIEPYEDCCTVFTPKHPRTRPVLKYVKEAQEKPNFGPLVEEALQNLKVTRISADDE